MDKNKKIKMSEKRISLEYLANKFVDVPYEERLEMSEAIDLKDNCIITDLGNGYSKIEPIDKTKLFKRKYMNNILKKIN